MKRSLAFATAISLLATGCASQASLQNLSSAQVDYAQTQAACYQGSQAACFSLPAKAAFVNVAAQQVEQEKQAGAAVGLGILALGLGVAAAATSPSCCYYHSWHRGWR